MSAVDWKRALTGNPGKLKDGEHLVVINDWWFHDGQVTRHEPKKSSLTRMVREYKKASSLQKAYLMCVWGTRCPLCMARVLEYIQDERKWENFRSRRARYLQGLVAKRKAETPAERDVRLAARRAIEEKRAARRANANKATGTAAKHDKDSNESEDGKKDDAKDDNTKS